MSEPSSSSRPVPQPAAPFARSQPGLHLMGDLYECRCEAPWLQDRERIARRCRELVAEAGLTAVGELFHAFGEGGGVTGVVVLAESHLSLHTWPESAYVTVDVFVCNHAADNRDRARQLFDGLVALFASAAPRFHSIDRA